VYFVKRLKWKVENELEWFYWRERRGPKEIIMKNKQKSHNNGKKLQICAKAPPVLLTNNWCSLL
jgi:hypothetical protein